MHIVLVFAPERHDAVLLFANFSDRVRRFFDVSVFVKHAVLTTNRCEQVILWHRWCDLQRLSLVNVVLLINDLQCDHALVSRVWIEDALLAALILVKHDFLALEVVLMFFFEVTD